MPGSLISALDNLYTTTWQNMKSDIQDQVLDGSPFWFWMRQNGATEKVIGGKFLTEPVRYASSDNIAYVKRGGAVPLSDKEFLTIAHDDWRYLTDTIVRFGIDDQQNRGKNQILSLMNAKLANSKDSLTDEMEKRMAGTAGTDQFVGLQDIVADAPSTSTVHNISGATDTWWRNQMLDFDGIDSFVNAGVSTMNTMFNSCSKNLRQDAPNIIVTGQTEWELYWDSTLEQKRISNKTMGDAGFQNVEFRGVPMVWSPQISTRMYFLNTRFLKFKYDPSMYFDMTEWKSIPEQVNDRVAQIVTAGNLMTGRRRVHGVLINVD